MGEHFARGRSAEIFRREDGKILKLFFPDYPREYAEKEYKNTKIAASLGCTGMQVYDMVERGGRFGFVMDCIDGVSQNDMPGKKPAYLFEAGRDLARCHVRVQKARRARGMSRYSRRGLYGVSDTGGKIARRRISPLSPG